MKKYIVIIFALLFSALIPSANSFALSGSDFNAGRIIDDAVFYNSSSMTVDQIQQFLNSKVPTCDTNGTKTSEYGGGTRAQWAASISKPFYPPFICLKDYSQTTPSMNASAYCSALPANTSAKSSAQIIYDVSVACGINPQVMLVLLQKEQALIFDEWPSPGQYTMATGYACPDTAACDPAFGGFFYQIYYAARQYKLYRANPNSYGYVAGRNNTIMWTTNAACGSSQVYIENQATAGLYNYTPYRPNQAALDNLYGMGDGCSSYGNRNFWRYFNDWFGSSLSGSKLSPLFKSEVTDKLYVVWEGTKYYIPDLGLLIAWGLHNYSVSQNSDSYLNILADGGTISNIIKISGDDSGDLYLLDDGKRYKIPYMACGKDMDGNSKQTSWNIDCFNTNVVKSYPQFLVSNYTVSDIELPQVIAFGDSAWKLEQGKKRRIIDPLIVDVLGGWSKVRWMKDSNASQPEGKIVIRNGYTIKFTGSDQIYRFDNETLHKVLTPEQFVSWGLQSQPVVTVQASYNAPEPLPVGDDVTLLAYDSNSDTYYIVLNGYKMKLGTSATTQWPKQNAISMNWTIGSMSEKPLSAIQRSPNGEIFTVYDSKKYIYPTMDDFGGLGAKINQIENVPYSVANTPGLEYGGLHLKDGRLFKVRDATDPNQIYMTKDSKSLLINSTKYPGLQYSGLILVDTTTANRYPVSGTYQP